MKKLIKKISLLVAVAVLAVAVVATTFGGTAYAAVTLAPVAIDAHNLQSEYELKDVAVSGIDLPTMDPSYTRVLKGPNGKAINVTGDNYKPTYAGYYTVEFYKEVASKMFAGSRTFKFKVAADDYTIAVDKNGADIPTYVKTETNVILPKANLTYVDAKGNTQPAPQVEIDKVKVEVIGAGFKKDAFNVNTASEADRTIKTGKDSGKYFVKYTYTGADITIQKDYTMTVDPEYVPSDEKPVLSVSGITDTAKLYTKVVLPKATATDGKDSNIKIDVEVTAPDNSKKVYTVDNADTMIDKSSGFILDTYKDSASADYYAKDGNATVSFDNDKNMTFYPHIIGASNTSAKYIVKYTATNDNGKSDAKEFAITVSQAERPKIKIDSKEIPAEFAITKQTSESGVVEYSESAADAVKAKFNLEIPVLDADNVISNVVKFADFKTLTAEYRASGDTSYTEVTKEGGKWIIKRDALSKMGDYEIRYKAQADTVDYDTAYAYFTVKVVAELKDTDKPSVTYDNLQATVKSGESLIKPNVKIIDNKGVISSEVKYEMYTSGDVLVGEIDEDMFYNGKINKFNAASVGLTDANFNTVSYIAVTVSAKDAIGNTLTIDNTSANVQRIQVINTSGTNTTFSAMGMADTANFDADGLYSTKIKSTATFSLTNIEITMNYAANAMAKAYPGLEIFARQPSKIENLEFIPGRIVDEMEVKFWVDSYTSRTGANQLKIYIEKFSFSPASDKAGIYEIVINFFDITGYTVSQSLFVEVEVEGSQTEEGNGIAPASSNKYVIPATAEFGNSVTIPSRFFKANDGSYTEATNPDYICRTTIVGPHFSMQGREMTALSKGDFTIVRGPADAVNEPNFTNVVHSFKSSDTVNPVIKLTGVVPSISENIKEAVIIPGAIATDLSGLNIYDEDGNVTEAVKITVTDTNGPVDLVDSASNPGMKEFMPKKDGKYTVTYKVTDNNGVEATQTYTIDVGDVHIPTIKIEDAKNIYKKEMKVGDKFQFFKVTANDKYYPEVTSGTPELTDKNVTANVYMKLKLDGEVKFSNTVGGANLPSSDYPFETPGTYTVEYTVTDAAGNEGKLTYTIDVKAKSTQKRISDKALAVILSVLGGLVVGGLVVYFVGARKKSTR